MKGERGKKKSLFSKEKTKNRPTDIITARKNRKKASREEKKKKKGGGAGPS